MSRQEPRVVSRAEVTDPAVLSLLSKLETLRAELRIAELRAAAVQKRLDKLQAKLVDRCAHENVDETSWYYNGSYDEVARTFYSHTCVTCGLKLKEWDKSHNRYG